MTDCIYCGKSLSRLERMRFKSMHSGCAKSQLEILEKYKSQFYELARKGNLSEVEALLELSEQGKFKEKQIDDAGLEIYNQLKKSTLEEATFTAEERENLRSLQKHLKLNDETAESAQLDEYRNLAHILEGNIPEIAANIKLQKNEVAHFETETRWCHRKTRRKRVAGSRGTRVRIAKGISVPVGKTQGTTEEYEEMQLVDEGRVIITSKRLLFIGSKKNLAVKHEKILDMDLYNDAVTVHRGTANPTIFFLEQSRLFYTILDAAIDNFA